MNDFIEALQTAASLIGHFDTELRGIVVLSLGVSLSAAAIAFAIGAPLGSALAIYRIPGKGLLIIVANALLGLTSHKMKRVELVGPTGVKRK
jgi:tungstate transport system permease protein